MTREFACMTRVAFVVSSLVLAFGQQNAHAIGAEDEPVEGVPEGYMLYEGDILLPVDDFATGTVAGTYEREARLWPGGIVPYQFGNAVSLTERQVARSAMDRWEEVANVRFVYRDGEDDHLFIYRGTSNFSEGVGRDGGRHLISISSWGIGTLLHELGHALGFWHEQSRADRGTYIDIEWNNICQNCCPDANGNPASCNHNFTIRDHGGEYGPYDFGSIMHYGQCDFSDCASCSANLNNCRTIAVRTPYASTWQNQIGQRSDLSSWDALVMSFMYPKDHWRFVNVDLDPFLPNGSFFEPYGGFDNAVDHTPAGGTLWVLENATIKDAEIFQDSSPQAITIRAPRGATFRR